MFEQSFPSSTSLKTNVRVVYVHIGSAMSSRPLLTRADCYKPATVPFVSNGRSKFDEKRRNQQHLSWQMYTDLSLAISGKLSTAPNHASGREKHDRPDVPVAQAAASGFPCQKTNK